MKFYQKRGFALVVLVLAILGSCVYGISKKPADLPQVSYGNWLRDDADLLTDETEASLRQYDQSWDSDYRAIIAVATLDTLNGWTYEKAAAELGSQWGLGGNDMLLLLVKDSDYYVALGDNVLDAMTDTYQAGLQGAVETPYYQGDYDAAALAFFRQADVFYAQTLGRQQSGGSYSDYEDNGAWQGNDSGSVAAVVLLVVGIFVVWILLDGLRYRRYRRHGAGHRLRHHPEHRRGRRRGLHRHHGGVAGTAQRLRYGAHLLLPGHPGEGRQHHQHRHQQRHTGIHVRYAHRYHPVLYAGQ